MKKIFSFFGEKMTELKSRLTQIGESEPLSKLALVVIIFLDIFILITIFTGLEDHTRQIATVEQYIPIDCQSVVIDANKKTNIEKIDIIKSRLNLDIYNYYPKPIDYVNIKPEQIHEVCNKIDETIKTFQNTPELKNLFLELSDNQNLKYKIQDELNQIKNNYDTVVLEKIANMESEAQNMQLKRNQKLAELSKIDENIKNTQTKILSQKDFISFWAYLLDNNSLKQKQLESDLRIAQFWFPIKKLLFELLFLIPLFIVFWFWNSYSISRLYGTQSLVSSHLLVITFIPIFWKIIEAIFEIIPKKLLEKVLEFLANFKLLAIWYYILVLLGILFGLFVIYIIQKKIFSRDRLNEKRLSSGDCHNCGKHLPNLHDGLDFCPFCGANQFKICPGCKKKTPFTSKFCIVCGFKF